ncbi:hypothetical protein PF005_g28538 [Phytophthora fragariae]|uniref:Secreted protein n=1 Tax=Phytophthora fragariae TaxID=53985 RepID=A0A6A3QK18_9STRA|nr:hypothetical protein PF009_g29886 [Phytophthora fragariae]KAE8967882.1 hypothetical protein PF011_g27397 [Phytophthora fragariae]KAE9066001.1 hypothetical protein PF010_g27981 [Phytophthora fragariae]KAE9076773.1 hypothetical protein PF006_g28055 [Phytophthora fragariae]KAE9126422.1 hypothetical protein PF007_g5975 [Phytophthora fragariae]
MRFLDLAVWACCCWAPVHLVAGGSSCCGCAPWLLLSVCVRHERAEGRDGVGVVGRTHQSAECAQKCHHQRSQNM